MQYPKCNAGFRIAVDDLWHQKKQAATIPSLLQPRWIYADITAAFPPPESDGYNDLRYVVGRNVVLMNSSS